MKPPTRKGFGTTIIDRSVPYDLGGHAWIEYARTASRRILHSRTAVVGVARRPHGRRSDSPPGGRPSVAPPAQVVRRQKVLLVEDSLIIALDAEDMLDRLGATRSVNTSSMAAALASSKPPRRRWRCSTSTSATDQLRRSRIGCRAQHAVPVRVGLWRAGAAAARACGPRVVQKP